MLTTPMTGALPLTSLVLGKRGSMGVKPRHWEGRHINFINSTILKGIMVNILLVREVLIVKKKKKNNNSL